MTASNVPSGKANKSSKKRDNDTCVYVWEPASDAATNTEWAWLRFDPEGNQDPKKIVEAYASEGKHAVIGKVSIGAPEGPPDGWTQPVGTVLAETTEAEEEAPRNPTPYICVIPNYYGTGMTPMLARKEMLKAGGGAAVEATVYKLPEDARGAYVNDAGEILWFGVAGQLTPVVTFKSGKRVEIRPPQEVEDEKPAAPQPDPTFLTDAEKQRIVERDAKPENVDQNLTPAVEAVDTAAKKAATARAAKNKAANAAKTQTVAEALAKESGVEVEEAKRDPATGHDVVGLADENGIASEPTPADFLLFIGGNFYTKDKFIEEAAQQGISRRMPSHRVPKDLVPGKSRVFVAAEGQRKADDDAPRSEVFGYFVPGRIEYLALGDGRTTADIVAALGLRPDTQVITTIEGEMLRACGQRKDGGTYLMVDKADSPLHLLAMPGHYVGNHFRGMMRLDATKAETFSTGGEVTTMVEEVCMTCGQGFKCAPDGHQRAERERRRIEKGGEAKWFLDCGKCRREKAKAKAAANKTEPESAPTETTEEDDSDPSMGTD